MSELFPCPFCGSTPKVFRYGSDQTLFSIRCTSCTANVCGFDQAAADAEEAWNKRSPMPTVAQQPGPQHLYRRVELGDGHISYQPVQETAQPVAWAILTDNGNIRMWSTINADVTAFAAQIGAVVIPLYPHPPQVTEGEPLTLGGTIAAVYGSFDAEDCTLIDREWARQRGYILPTDGTATLNRMTLETVRQVGAAREKRLAQALGELEAARDYVLKAIASYDGDPPDNQFQRGHLAALEVVRDEAFAPASVSSTQRGGAPK